MYQTTNLKLVSFYAAALSLRDERATLTFWDPTLSIISVLVVSAGFSGFGFSTESLLCASFAVAASLAARTRLTVTRQCAVGEYCVFGLCWRRFDLGREPVVSSGAEWSWSEVSVFPTHTSLRDRLHDRERFVLCDWIGESDAKTQEADSVVSRMQDEIVRLHV
jgi:hypothetical protein